MQKVANGRNYVDASLTTTLVGREKKEREENTCVLLDPRRGLQLPFCANGSHIVESKAREAGQEPEHLQESQSHIIYNHKNHKNHKCLGVIIIIRMTQNTRIIK